MIVMESSHKELLSMIEMHNMQDEKRFSEIDTLLKIVENHIAHVQTDMMWVKWLLLGLVGAIGTIVVAVLVAIFTKYI